MNKLTLFKDITDGNDKLLLSVWPDETCEICIEGWMDQASIRLTPDSSGVENAKIIVSALKTWIEHREKFMSQNFA